MKKLPNLTAVKREEVKTQEDLDNMVRIAYQHGFDMQAQYIDSKITIDDCDGDYIGVSNGCRVLQDLKSLRADTPLNIITLDEFMSYDKEPKHRQYTGEMRLKGVMPKVGDCVVLNVLKGSLNSYEASANNGELMEVLGIENSRIYLKSPSTGYECYVNRIHILAVDEDRSKIYLGNVDKMTNSSEGGELIIGKCGTKVLVDVYRVLDAFNVNDPLIADIITRLLNLKDLSGESLLKQLDYVKDNLEEVIKLEGQR